MLRIKPLLGLLLIPLINACSDLDNSIPPAELTKYEQKIELKNNWSHSLGGGSDFFHRIEPALFEGDIYTVSSTGLISKVNVQSGQIIWQSSRQQKTYAGLAVSADVIALASSDGLLSIYKNSAELDLVWQKHVQSEVNIQPIINGNELYVRLSNGQLNSYDLKTGDMLWSVSRRVPKLSLTGSSKPSVFDDLVLSGFDDGRLVAFDRKNGDTAWEKAISVPTGRSELDRMVDLDGAFIIKNNVIYVSAFQGRLAAIQIQDGSELWSRPMSSVKQISADENAIYVSDQDSNLWSIDRRSGAALWKQDELHHRGVTAMGAVGDTVVVADFEGYAHWLNKQTGQLVARMSISGSKMLNPPIIYKEQILFLDAANNLTSVSVVN